MTEQIRIGEASLTLTTSVILWFGLCDQGDSLRIRLQSRGIVKYAAPFLVEATETLLVPDIAYESP